MVSDEEVEAPIKNLSPEVYARFGPALSGSPWPAARRSARLGEEPKKYQSIGSGERQGSLSHSVIPCLYFS
jgi:hypothetical protein